jgi:hypothetical protein
LVQDYQTYKARRNVTFIGINSSSTATLKTMESQIKQFNLKPFANMLDAGGATAAAYGVPRSAPFWLVVIDGDGKIAYNASKGWFWSSGPNAGKTIHSTQIEKSLGQYTAGVLGRLDVPKEMEAAAHYYDLQQLDLVEVELRKASTPAAKAFAEKLRARIAESRVARKAQIEALSGTDPVQAYREATSFVAAFPSAPERGAVNELGRDLQKQPAVKKEIEAEAAYHRMIVPELKKATTPDKYTRMVKPLLEAYLKAFGATQFGAVVKVACEAHLQKVTEAN